MPQEKGYGMKKADKFDIKKTKAWGENLKGNPKPQQIYKGKGGK